MPLKLIAPREGKTPYFYIRGTYLEKRVFRSSGCTDRATAQRELKKIERDIERGRYAEARGPTFADAALAYINAGGDRRFLKPLADHFKDTPLIEIGQAEIDRAAQAIYPTASPATCNRQVYTPVSAILKRAGSALLLKRPKGSQGEVRTQWLWPEEAGRLFEEAAKVDRELATLLIFLTYTGLRLGEALSLRARDIRMADRFAYLPTSKNEDPRAVYLPPVVVAALSAHPRGLDRQDRLFRFTRGSALYRMLGKATEAAGCPWFGFHGCRHTWATWMRRYAGLDARGLVGTGAWKDAKSASRYAHVVSTEEAKRADSLPVPNLATFAPQESNGGSVGPA